MTEPLRIAFMGSPDFAVPVLTALVDAGLEVACVYSQPPRPAGRGKKLRPALQRLFEIYDERGCVGLIMGLPLNLAGSSGPRVQAAKALSHNLLKDRDVPLTFQDERLSSAEAERVMLAADLSRARRAETIDASAAAIILQTALDRLANTYG